LFIFTFMLLRFIIGMNTMLNVKKIPYHLWCSYSFHTDAKNMNKALWKLIKEQTYYHASK